jgi:hypothetical protein
MTDQKMSKHEEIAEVAAGIVRQLTDEGKLIGAGFAMYRAEVLPLDASMVQVDECRLAFFAGAQHLFGSIMGMLDPGSEPTDADLERMDSIDRELSGFAEELKLRSIAHAALSGKDGT